MKNKSYIFFLLAVLIFLIVIFFAYTYISKNGAPFFGDNKKTENDNSSSFKKQITVDELTSALADANKNATTSQVELNKIQNALEQANKVEAAPKATSQIDLQAELEKQAQSDKQRRDLADALQNANQ